MKNNYIALIGEWNTSNIGDRAIGLYACQYLLSFGFTIKLFALGSFRYLGEVANSEQLGEVFSAPQTPVIPFEGVLKRKMSRVVHKHFPEMKFLFRFFRNYLSQEALIKQLSECKAVLVGGGALLDDDGLHFPSSLFLIKNVSKKLQIPLYSVGCSSSGRFSYLGKLILRDFMSYASVVAVRDAASREALQPICNKPIHIFGDFALSPNSIVPRKITDRVKEIAINVMHFTGEDKELQPGYEMFLMQLMAALRRRADISITLFTTGDPNDLAVANNINATMRLNHSVFHPQSFSEIVTFFKGSDLVLCTRLHAAIMAINENIPSIALWVKPKIKNFFQTIALSDFCIHCDWRERAFRTGMDEMINEMLDVKLIGYFQNINFDYFSDGREIVFKSLVGQASKLKEERCV